MKTIVAILNMNTTTPLREAARAVDELAPGETSYRQIFAEDYEDPDIPLDEVTALIENADLVLIDQRADCRLLRALPSILKQARGTIVVLVAARQDLFACTSIGSFRGDRIFKGRDRHFDVHVYRKTKRFTALMKRIGKMIPVGMVRDMHNWVIAQEYYTEGDSANLTNMLLLLLGTYCGIRLPSPQPPRHSPPYALYDPTSGALFESVESLRAAAGYDPSLPTVGILIYGGMHFNDTRPMADALAKRLRGIAHTLVVASKAEYNLEALRRCLRGVDLIVNLQYFRIHGGPFGGEAEPTIEFLNECDVPLLAPVRSYETSIDQWNTSKEGLNPMEVVLAVTLPELDGAIEPFFIGGPVRGNDPCIGRVQWMEAIPERIEAFAARITAWLRLRTTPNSGKRLALIMYNYPPGEHNLANAGYLDTFASLHVFLDALEKEGFLIQKPDIPLRELIIERGMVNAPHYGTAGGIRLSAEEYREWFAQLPTPMQQDVQRVWGAPPGEIMTEGGSIVLPILEMGNILLCVQPARGGEDAQQSYHDRSLPPHHQYLAFYLYLNKKADIHAVVHFGMHGTLEFMPGKEAALSHECYPDLLIGHLPNIYYYWVGNPSESTIAKRRSYALCVSHASPPFESSGLYERYAALEEMILDAQESRDNNDEMWREIREAASELHLPDDPAKLACELARMKRRLIPRGLHVMDRTPDERDLIEYCTALMRVDREFPSIHRMIAEMRGRNWDEERYKPGADDIEKAASEAVASALHNNDPSWFPAGMGDYLRRITADRLSSRESAGLIRAIAGRFVTPACAGDPMRDPGVYPTGRGMYAFDPRLVPTPAAERRGRHMAEALIETYKKRHNQYPDRIGIVLWGFETMKTGGDSVAAILSLIGVRIKRKKNVWFRDLELIPLEELGRPRIDVLVTMCGIFRDTFGVLIELMNRAFEMAACSDEPDDANYIARHNRKDSVELGRDALARLFGPAPSEYGTNVTDIIEQGSWHDEAELGACFEECMNYAYTRRGAVKSPEAFARALRTVSLVTQERDSVEYEVTDLDHYYEFLGGLSRSVQNHRGNQTPILVMDTVEDEVLVEDLQCSVERSGRTRLFNPKWINGMLAHQYHGGQKIRDRVANLLGFAATTGRVPDWVFHETAERLLLDDETREQLQRNNPHAAVKIGELLVESERRGYWRPDPGTSARLRDIIISMEADVE